MIRKPSKLLIALVSSTSTSTAYAQQWSNSGYGHMMGPGGWFFGLLLLLLVVGIVMFVLRQTGGLRGDSRSQDTDEPMTILKSRFAKGEIDQQEFEQRRSVLESSDSPRT